jgi:LasA protease
MLKLAVVGIQKGGHHRSVVLCSIFLLLVTTACNRPAVVTTPAATTEAPASTPIDLQTTPPGTQIEPQSAPPSPTPDPIRTLPPLQNEFSTHIVQAGESIAFIALNYGVAPIHILEANGLDPDNYLYAGQVLTIPPLDLQAMGPSTKILPDSDFVFGPSSVAYDTVGTIYDLGGYLNRYQEEFEGELLDGPDIIQRIAQTYSVSPRLLLAVLEYQSGWVTHDAVRPETLSYPMGHMDPDRAGLFRQLAWAADQLNTGYYRWRAGWAGPYFTIEGSVIPPGEGINAATAGVQYMFAQLYQADQWRQVVAEEGFPALYVEMFGNPFSRAVEPLVPADLVQPPMQLPFEEGAVWSFTGGPHSAWGDGAAWAALDFAPPGYALGCVYSPEWIVAAADGLVVRSDVGEVLIDLDGDGYEQTGWVLFYLHVGSEDRIPAGTYVHAGDRLGHPSCEGGISTGIHVHLARKYNGEWIPADSWLPFNLDGWISAGDGWPYDGTLSRDGVELEACGCRADFNQISR